MRVIPYVVGLTALSNTADTDTAIGGGAWDIPVWAKSIMSMGLAVQADLPTATQAILCRSNLTSDNLPIQPFEAFAAPLSGILGASGNGPSPGAVEKYDVNLRCNGGERLTGNIRPLTTNTTDYGSLMYVVSDAVPMEAQRHIKAGTLTTDTAVSSENPGTQYSISGARNIKQLLGVMAPATVAGSEGMVHRIRFSSNEFAGVSNADLLMNSPQSGLATLQSASIPGGVSRVDCNIPIQPVSQCNIQDYWYALSSTTLATATPWCSAVSYEV